MESKRMTDECMYRSCTNEAVSRCFGTERLDSPLRVCFTHERELVDRYGVSVVLPESIGDWTLGVRAAVKYLREGV